MNGYNSEAEPNSFSLSMIFGKTEKGYTKVWGVHSPTFLEKQQQLLVLTSKGALYLFVETFPHSKR